jgi:hypothetical protein
VLSLPPSSQRRHVGRLRWSSSSAKSVTGTAQVAPRGENVVKADGSVALLVAGLRRAEKIGAEHGDEMIRSLVAAGVPCRTRQEALTAI